jgi:ribosomal protein S18 acetylase RimI-like enzyme
MAVADLIEICFATSLDEDGRDYLRQMRWAARDYTYLSWIQGAAERIASPLFGFVWEEDGRIVGNLSLIPLTRRARLYYLIANVAVHPNYRRRGIGRQLTQAAIEHLRERGLETAWLQVREDNPGAHQLYRSLGFVDRAVRTAWLTGRGAPRGEMPPGVLVTRRRPQDWDVQQALLRHAYPPEVAWNLPLQVGRFSPAPLGMLWRWLQGETQMHWVARAGERPLGFLSWEPMRGSADSLWLGADPEREHESVLALLLRARADLARRNRPLTVNYPAGRAVQAFAQAGFVANQTLVWMSIDLLQRIH